MDIPPATTRTGRIVLGIAIALAFVLLGGGLTAFILRGSPVTPATGQPATATVVSSASLATSVPSTAVVASPTPVPVTPTSPPAATVATTAMATPTTATTVPALTPTTPATPGVANATVIAAIYATATAQTQARGGQVWADLNQQLGGFVEAGRLGDGALGDEAWQAFERAMAGVAAAVAANEPGPMQSVVTASYLASFREVFESRKGTGERYESRYILRPQPQLPIWQERREADVLRLVAAWHRQGLTFDAKTNEILPSARTLPQCVLVTLRREAGVLRLDSAFVLTPSACPNGLPEPITVPTPSSIAPRKP